LSLHMLDTITGHFGDESFQGIDCTGADNQRTTKYIKKTQVTDANRMRNKLVLVKKKHKTHKTETGPSSPIRTAHMSVHIIGYNNFGIIIIIFA